MCRHEKRIFGTKCASHGCRLDTAEQLPLVAIDRDDEQVIINRLERPTLIAEEGSKCTKYLIQQILTSFPGVLELDYTHAASLAQPGVCRRPYSLPGMTTDARNATARIRARRATAMSNVRAVFMSTSCRIYVNHRSGRSLQRSIALMYWCST